MSHYRPQKKTPTYVPLTTFVKHAPLPKKAYKHLKDAKYINTIRCAICGEETLRIYKLPPPRVGGLMVCENPHCEAFGIVMPI